MKAKVLAALLAVFCITSALGQGGGKPTLAILPFTGAGIEGGRIADSLALQPDIRRTFTRVAVSPAALEIFLGRMSRITALTDSDFVSGLGRELGADYLISGHVRRVGNRFLVTVSVIDSGNYELVAGFYRLFYGNREIGGLLPVMARQMTDTVRKRQGLGPLPALAVAPPGFDDEPLSRFETTVSGVNYDVETLTQILSIEIANMGLYAVLPRGTVLRNALLLWESYFPGEVTVTMERLFLKLRIIFESSEPVTAPYRLVGPMETMGRAADAEFVLSVNNRETDGANVFQAGLFRAFGDEQLAVVAQGYRSLAEGLDIMPDVAIALVNPPDSDARLAQLVQRRWKSRLIEDPARFWSIGAAVGTSFNDPWAIGTFMATFAPLPFSFLKVGVDAGFISDLVPGIDYFSLYPFVHYALFVPFGAASWYLGGGGGYMIARYVVGGFEHNVGAPLVDLGTGFVIGNLLDVSYTLRTNFSSINGKLSVGLTYRFR
ncbi:MAG: hypothetical protein FWD94_02985 [Treponema sp.]|nr:hypothetical protein [Treponema sp.]